MRVLLVVLDSVGIGALPDADQYGDAGSNTLGHTARTVGQLKLPVLEKLGLANILDVSGLKAQDEPLGCYGRMAEAAQGKDTITGHWELAGVIVSEPFRTYPRGFPAGLIEQFTRRIGRGIFGQCRRLRHRNHCPAGQGAYGDGQTDSIHIRRQRISNCRPRGGNPPG